MYDVLINVLYDMATSVCKCIDVKYLLFQLNLDFKKLIMVFNFLKNCKILEKDKIKLKNRRKTVSINRN